MELDDRIRRMLRELGRALSEVIAESSEVSQTLREIRSEGYSLYLLVDCKRTEEGSEALELGPRRLASSGEPEFRIDGRDLFFLRSIGIDPTRRRRSRRRDEPRR